MGKIRGLYTGCKFINNLAMKIIYILLTLMLPFTSCNSNNRDSNYRESDSKENVSADYAPAPPAAMESVDEGQASDKAGYSKVNATNGNQSQNIPAPAPEKKLIKNGSLNMQVEDYAKTRPRINQLIAQHKGYIGSENETNSGNSLQNHITIRVPFNEFDGLVNNLEKEAKFVESKSVNVQDVTAQFVDIEGRLKTRREVEARYMEFLKKAKNIDETLKIEEQIRQLREEIESAEGQLKLMRDQVMYSTLELTVYQHLPYKVSPATETGFFAKLGEAFKSGWRIMLDLIVGLAYLWPFLIVGFVLLLFLRKKFRKQEIGDRKQKTGDRM
ncbi:MAG: DUF4349 domain-containing protein [Bacteroidia bacterium]